MVKEWRGQCTGEFGKGGARVGTVDVLRFLLFHVDPILTCWAVECSRYNVIYHRRRRDRQNIQTCVLSTTPLDGPPKKEEKKKLTL